MITLHAVASSTMMGHAAVRPLHEGQARVIQKVDMQQELWPLLIRRKTLWEVLE